MLACSTEIFKYLHHRGEAFQTKRELESDQACQMLASQPQTKKAARLMAAEPLRTPSLQQAEEVSLLYVRVRESMGQNCV